jgi:hypothetical membrane protein
MRPRTIFSYARWAALWSGLLTVLAMLAYPGGTLRNPSSRGYSFFQNFLSDLAATVAWDGQPNRLSASLFMAAIAVLAIAIAGCFLGLVGVCSSSTGQRRLARAAASVAALSCVGLLGAVATPPDRFLSLHVWFAFSAFTCACVATLLFALATARDPRFGIGVTVGWVALTLVPLVLISTRWWGPGVATDGGLTFYATAQKLAAITYIIVCVYQARAAERVLGTPDRPVSASA